MQTTICKLTLTGGQTITATVIARAPEDRPPITWQGDVTLLPRHRTTASPAVLNAFCQNLAEELGARLESHSSGQYDIWAE